jgi:hypothetical protein
MVRSLQVCSRCFCISIEIVVEMVVEMVVEIITETVGQCNAALAFACSA